MTRTASHTGHAHARALVLLTCVAIVSSWCVSSPVFAVGEPITVPVITAPTNGTPVAGDVAITATSTAPSVQFYLDATPFGSPGAGGAFGFADPSMGIGYGYVTSRMGTYLTGDPRDVALRDALYSALRVVV